MLTRIKNLKVIVQIRIRKKNPIFRILKNKRITLKNPRRLDHKNCYHSKSHCKKLRIKLTKYRPKLLKTKINLRMYRSPKNLYPKIRIQTRISNWIKLEVNQNVEDKQ